MLIRLDALSVHLSKGLMPFYALFGDEVLLLQEVADAIRAKAKQAGFSERTVYEIEKNFDWSTLIGQSQSFSLFGERQLIELRFTSVKLTKEVAEQLQYLIAQAHSDVMYLLVFPRLDLATQKAAWFSTLQKAGCVVKIDAINRAQLPQWIKQRLALQKQVVDSQGLQLIVDRVEGNLLAAHQELQKLAFIYPEGNLSFEQVHDAVMDVARYDVFKLNEVMLSGKLGYLARMLAGLKGEGEAPHLVLWALSEEIRTLLKIKRSIQAGQSISAALKEYRIWGAREALMASALPKLNSTDLLEALSFAASLDRQIKGVSSVLNDSLPADVWDGLFELAMKVSAPIQ